MTASRFGLASVAALGVGALALAGVAVASGAAATGGDTEAVPPDAGLITPGFAQEFNAPYDGLFHFVRIRFDAGGGGGGGFFRRRGGGVWAHDYPRADINFLSILNETTLVRSYRDGSQVLRFDDPELFKYPIAYIVEVGFWNPTEAEVGALREYLLKGGFLIVDDFRGYGELRNLEFHLKRALPELDMMEVEDTDDVFDSFFRIVPREVVPPYGGQAPLWYGLYEDNDRDGRLMVVINANNDIAEYWEFSDYGYYPIELSNEAYKLGVNYVVYGLTH